VSLAEPRTLLERLIAEGAHTWQEIETRFNRRAEARGERVSLTWRHLQRIAAGEVGRPRPIVARVLADLFGHPVEDLLGPPAGPAPGPRGHEAGADPLDRLLHLRLGVPDTGRVGRAEVEQVRFLTASIAAQENVFGGGCATETGPAALRWSTALLSARADTDVRAELHEAVGNLASVVAFVAFDIGDHTAAAQLSSAALWCAEQSGSWPLRAAVLADTARRHLAAGRLDEALSAVEFARVREDRLTATGRASVAVLRAQVLSAMSRYDDARAEVDRADAEFAHRDPVADQPWLTYYDEAEHAGSTAKALIPLDVLAGRPGIAAERLAEAVARQRAGYPRSRAFSATRLAVLQLRIDDPRRAVRTARPVVDDAGTVRSRRLRDHLGELARACRPHRRIAEVRDLAADLAHA
jgi:hypothetical protein